MTGKDSIAGRRKISGATGGGAFGGMASILLAAALMMVPDAARAACPSGFICFDSTPASEAPKDDGSCTIDGDMGLTWIAKIPSLRALKEKYDFAVSELGLRKEDAAFFGPPDDSIRAAKNQADAQSDLQATGAVLLQLAQKYASKRLKSCDRCVIGNTLGLLYYVAEGQVGRIVERGANGTPIFGKGKKGFLIKRGTSTFVDIETITKGQLDDDRIKNKAEQYAKWLAIREQAPDEVTKAQQDECIELFPDKDPNKQLCNKANIDSWLNKANDDIVDLLEPATKVKKDTTGLASEYYLNGTGGVALTCRSQLPPNVPPLFQYTRYTRFYLGDPK